MTVVRRMHRDFIITLLVMAGIAGGVRDARAAEPLTGTMQCERAVEPGRVKCSVEVHAETGRTIAWADVVVVALPTFVSALKGRLGSVDSTFHDGTSQKWAFAILAKKVGQGEVKARIRTSLCEGASTTRCVPVAIDVAAPVVVGS